jgi:hypothetical protein
MPNVLATTSRFVLVLTPTDFLPFFVRPGEGWLRFQRVSEASASSPCQRRKPSLRSSRVLALSWLGSGASGHRNAPATTTAARLARRSCSFVIGASFPARHRGKIDSGLLALESPTELTHGKSEFSKNHARNSAASRFLKDVAFSPTEKPPVACCYFRSST